MTDEERADAFMLRNLHDKLVQLMRDVRADERDKAREEYRERAASSFEAHELIIRLRASLKTIEQMSCTYHSPVAQLRAINRAANEAECDPWK